MMNSAFVPSPFYALQRRKGLRESSLDERGTASTSWRAYRTPRCALKGKGDEDDVSFSSMAAGPGSTQKRMGGRLGSRQRKKEKRSMKVPKKTAADFVAEGIVDEVETPSAFDEATGVEKVGTLPTPEDFAAKAAELAELNTIKKKENTAQRTFEQGDIRFGVGDVADPFLKDAERSSEERAQASIKEDERSKGKVMDVTGDGGVLKRIVSVGDGETVPSGASVMVQYTGELEDGSVFDSTRSRGNKGFEFVLGAGTVIKGWEAGVATMKRGEVAELTISARYAYGRRGMPPTIPGNATLKFTIEVQDVVTVERSDQTIKRVADFNPEVSRTPEDIARDYGILMEKSEERKKKMTLFDRFYIISPFASQTGEAPPWWLNPKLTFVGIFALVGVAFYLVYISGAIHQGYVEGTVDVNIFK